MDLHLINRKLKENYGNGPDLVNPLWRVVFSEDEVEHRKELFKDYIPGTNILLREVNEVRLVKKYNYLDPQYVLEYMVHNLNDTVIDTKNLSSKVTYEPFFAFGQENGRPKQLVWRAIELLIHLHTNPEKVLSPKSMEEADLKDLENDERLMLDMLNERELQTPFGMAVKDGDAVVMPTNYPTDSPLMRKEDNNVTE